MNQNDFFEPIARVSQLALRLLPHLTASVVVIIAGLLLGWFVRVLVSRLLALLRFDLLCDRLGISAMLARGGLATRPSRLTGGLFGGIIVVTATLLSLASLDTDLANSLLTRFGNFLPTVFTAVVIFIGGVLAAKFLQRGVLIALVNAEIAGARIVSGAAGIGVMAFVMAVALEQLGIGARIVTTAFAILFGGVVVALSISFGLAGRDMARSFLERHLAQRKDGDSDGVSHL
ncbi:MAG: hypothetical protein HYX75_18510 [Acidobacteria bacterium]|nr:hypothetical protein [Acidobacteriota bacterium]